MEDDVTDGGSVIAMATVVQAGAESDDNLDATEEGREVDGESDSESEDEFGYTWKKLSQRYSDLDGELHAIELNKGDRGLGLSLAGNKDRSKTSVFVVGVNPAGAAGKDGRILIGDEVLEINGIKVFGHSHQNASSIIGGLAPGLAKVVILRNQEFLNQLAVPPVIYPNQTSLPTILTKQEAVDEADAPAPALEPEPERPLPTPADYPNTKNITLQKGPRGLGFAIYENEDEKGLSGIFVKDVTMGGPAATEGNLKVGDQILAVNDKSVIGLSKLSAISVLKDTKGSVALTVGATKPVASPKPQPKSLFPTLDTGGGFEGGVAITASAQPDVFAGAPMKSQSGHGNFFPALDIDEESSTFLATSSISYQAVGDTETAAPAEQRSDSHPPSDPLICPVVKGHKTLIVVDRGYDKGLGISLVGGADTQQNTIMIQSIKPDGAVAKDGRLQAGDQILEVDGLDFETITHEAALNVLRQTASKVRMLVLRDDPPPSTPTAAPSQGEEEEVDEDAEAFTVIIHQPAGQSLGLSIAGKGGALYVSDIAQGSVADNNGQLMRGDQIIAVNNLAVKNIPQEALATLRQNEEGDVFLKISRSGGSRLSMSSFETVVTAQPVTVEQSPSPGIAETRREEFSQSQESFGSSTEIFSEEEETSSSSGVKTVTLERGPDGLGFSIVGGYGSPHGNLPIYIKTVFNRGAAAVAKQLKRGDQILAVNGESLEGATHQTAVNLLKKARGQVILTVVTN